MFIGIDCESPMRSINNCAVLHCSSDSVFLQDLQTLTPDLVTQTPCCTAVISPPQIPTKDTPSILVPRFLPRNNPTVPTLQTHIHRPVSRRHARGCQSLALFNAGVLRRAQNHVLLAQYTVLPHQHDEIGLSCCAPQI